MSEKRREKRINSILPVTVKTGDGPVRAVTMNLSTGGIGFLSQKLIAPGNCSLTLADSNHKGRILYRKMHTETALGNGKVYQYGVALNVALKPEQMDRLILQSRMPSRGLA